jgi:hypothetical protein
MTMPAFPVAALPSSQSQDYLGPAEVVRAEGGTLHVRLRGGAVRQADLALALPYEPAVGDSLLVIGRGREHYVIGVLQGRGHTALTLEGDVDLRAANGRLRVSGDHGVELSGPEIELRAGRLEMFAGAVRQRFASICQRVSDLVSMHAGEAHTVVRGTQLAQAHTAAILTEGTVTINGKQVHLG